MKDIIARDYAEVSSAQEIIVKRIWDHFGDEEWDKLIENMPERMKAVIAARDESIRFSIVYRLAFFPFIIHVSLSRMIWLRSNSLISVVGSVDFW